MNRGAPGGWVILILLAAALVVPLPGIVHADPAGLAPYEIPLAGGRIPPPDEGVDPDLVGADRPDVVLVQFFNPPTNDLRRRLRAKGIAIQDRVHGTTFFARLDPDIDVENAIAEADASRDVRAVLAVPPVFKVSPDILEPSPPGYLMSEESGVLRAVVVFHRDMTAARARDVLDRHVRRYEPFDPPRVWRVEATTEQLKALAEDKTVRWVRRPAAGFVPLADGLRGSSAVDDVQKMSVESTVPRFDGLDGSGVRVAVFDCPLTTRDGDTVHSDLMTVSSSGSATDPVRVEQAEASNPSTCSDGYEHGDWVVGLAVGTGIQSGREDTSGVPNPGESYDLRGVAPAAVVRMFPANPYAGAADLTASVSDDPISNHSYLTDFLVYDVFSRSLDRATLGFPGDDTIGVHTTSGQVVVAAAGNAGTFQDRGAKNTDYYCGKARGYFSVYSPAKNAIVVGASYGGDVDPRSSRSPRSSLGPTPDGRLKPDLIAPGCRLDHAMFGPRVIRTSTDSYDIAECGTSFSAALTTGIAALMTQRWDQVRVGDEPARLFPSTIKAALVAGALDMVAEPSPTCESYASTTAEASCVGDGIAGTAGYGPGPDYATGFGHVRADAAVAAIGDRRFLEGAVTAGDRRWSHPIDVPEGATAIRVALAWDDPPYDGNATSSALVNDLDLTVRTPADEGGTGDGHGPWVPPVIDWKILVDGTVIAPDLWTGCPANYEGIEDLGFGGENPPNAIRCRESGGSYVDVDTGTVRDRAECKDARNNVERVDVESPAAGAWTIEVEFDGPTESQAQDFSVAWVVEGGGTNFVSRRRCLPITLAADVSGDYLRLIDSAQPIGAGVPRCRRSPIEDVCKANPGLGICLRPCPFDPCPVFRGDVSNWPRGLTVEILDEAGAPVARMRSGERRGGRAKFRPVAGVEYEVRITPIDPDDARKEWLIPARRGGRPPLDR